MEITQHHQLLNEQFEQSHKILIEEIEIDANKFKKQASTSGYGVEENCVQTQCFHTWIKGSILFKRGFQFNQRDFIKLKLLKISQIQLLPILQKRTSYTNGSKLQYININKQLKSLEYKNKLCPQRQRLDLEDLILYPYNYFLEKDFQDVVEIENCILIFDEAHNAQSTAEDGSSFLITHNNIIEAEKILKNGLINQNQYQFFMINKTKLNAAIQPSELKEFRSIMNCLIFGIIQKQSSIYQF
ncbi:unnamed protein product [Paramecium sonneborni]|uniref:RAD3-like helicase DEAD domain-containing protein n=1 Tax=Paramecium sonneborni TaxID=65129 RepID=A0A8S1RNK0_9CILI|nr:unnamed protein product [Paramecium sonneborni]